MSHFVIPQWENIHYYPGEDFCIKYSPEDGVGDFHAPAGCIIASSKNINIETGGLYRIVQLADTNGGGLELVLSYNGHKKKRVWELCESADKWISVKNVGQRRFSPEMKDYVKTYEIPFKGVWRDYIDFLKSPHNSVATLAVDIHNKLGDTEDFDWDVEYRENLEVCMSWQKSRLEEVKSHVNSVQTRINQALPVNYRHLPT